MQLVLGTVQFGLAYGLAGRNVPVAEAEVRAILARAVALGIQTLDTAAAYGSIESRLVDLAGDHAFKVITKLPAAPESLSAPALRQWVDASLHKIDEHLQRTVSGLMFHRADDLLGPHADWMWQRCSTWAQERGVKLGVSCYDPETLVNIRNRFPVSVAQIPGNVLDQRIAAADPAALEGMELHLRSAFLQGLLLMPPDLAVRRVPAASAALDRFHAWRNRLGKSPLQAALSAVKSLPLVTHCVVGVDSLSHLNEIAEAWHEAECVELPSDILADLDVIDPRRWPASQ